MDTNASSTVEHDIEDASTRLNVLGLGREDGNAQEDTQVSSSTHGVDGDSNLFPWDLGELSASLDEDISREGHVSSSNPGVAGDNILDGNEPEERNDSSPNLGEAGDNTLGEGARAEANANTDAGNAANTPRARQHAGNAAAGDATSIPQAFVDAGNQLYAYYRANSRRTLRYRRYREGLIMLLPDSDIPIYINRNTNLRPNVNLTLTPTYYTTLTETLLRAVFLSRALSVCSRTGTRSRTQRPALDQNAITQIATYVNRRTGKDEELVLICITKKLDAFHGIEIDDPPSNDNTSDENDDNV